MTECAWSECACRRRTATIPVRVYPNEQAALIEAAAARGVTVGQLVRQALSPFIEAAALRSADRGRPRSVAGQLGDVEVTDYLPLAKVRG